VGKGEQLRGEFISARGTDREGRSEEHSDDWRDKRYSYQAAKMRPMKMLKVQYQEKGSQQKLSQKKNWSRCQEKIPKEKKRRIHKLRCSLLGRRS
jgi:hypothetical protein